MGCCTSTPTPPQPAPSAGLSAIELGAYEPSSPFPLSIADAVSQYQAGYPACSAAWLQQQRDEYWDTRVEGDQAVWLVLRRVCECDEGDGMREVMLDSAGLQHWSIDKPDGVFTYDVKGVRYDVPFFCLYPPDTLITAEQEAANAAAAQQPAAASTPACPDPQDSPLTASQPSPARDSRSLSHQSSPLATTPSTGDTKGIKFKLRFSDGAYTDLPLSLSPNTSLAAVRAMVRDKVGLIEDRQVYFLHGKRLSGGTVGEIGLEKGMVLQCFVKQVPQEAPQLVEQQ